MREHLERIGELYREGGTREVYRGIRDFLLLEVGLPGHYIWSTRDMTVGDTTVTIRVTDAESFSRTTAMAWGEAGMLESFVDRIGENNTLVWDVGANIGGYTLLAAEKGAYVTSFEPGESTQSELNLNVIENGLLDRVSTRQVALSNESGEAKLSHEEKTGSRTVAEHGETIQLIKGDRLKNEKPEVVKIDVEGHEVAVLEGMRETLETSVETVYIEIHDFVPNIDVLRILWDSGFTVTEEYENRRDETHLRLDKERSLAERSTLVERK
jgi:FkbM family methyltransferase